MNGENHEGPLRLVDVSVYGTGEAGETRPIALGLNLTVHKGEWLYVVGANGSGKSTLGRLVAGLSAGEVRGTVERGFAGFYPAAYVMQQPDAQLFGQTPREELAFALEWLGLPQEEAERKAERALHLAGLSEAADLPWSRLSGGQRQMAAIAAAYAGEPDLIVFDEATSMLDDAARRRVRAMAGQLEARGAVVIWITQRLDELEPDRRVIALSGGRIRYDGNVRNFFYGEPGNGVSPCAECGLRLPYLARLALELGRAGKLAHPLPVSLEEWQAAKLRPDPAKAHSEREHLRKEHPEAHPIEAHPGEVHQGKRHTKEAHLIEVHPSESHLRGTRSVEAFLRETHPGEAQMRDTDMGEAHPKEANPKGARPGKAGERRVEIGP